MEPITISKLIRELTVIKQLHGDLKVCNIVYGDVERIYAVKLETYLKRDKNKQIKEEEKVVLIY